MEKNSISTPVQFLVLAGSAGSLEVLLNIFPSLRKHLPFAILIVLHRSNEGDPLLQSILSTKTSIPVREVEEKDPIERGNIYIAPADYHLLIEKNHIFSLDYSEKVNYSRPSIDVTFESAAEAYRDALICILLSGANSDGSDGLALVKKLGGKIAVQDPTSAAVSFMPQYALQRTKVDHILSPDTMADFINNLI